MTITVSGLGSGLNYDSWISELVAIKQADIDKVSSQVKSIKKQESALSTIENDYKSLLDAIETFTDALSTTDVFNQKKAASSSDAISASVTSKAATQNLSILVSQLATATTAESQYPVASYVNSTTALNNITGGMIKEGSFSVYVNGSKSSIDIKAGETVQKVIDDLNKITGVSASLSNDGKLTIQSSDSGTYSVTTGSSTDTSNFSNVMSLTKNSSTGAYTSSKSIFDTNTTTAITGTTFATSGGADTTVQQGTFTIGNVEFTIDANTSLNDVINKINSSDCGATATWDPNSGKFSLTASDEGALSINVQAGTSNFTDVMGLTNSTWTTTVSEDGTTTTTTLASTKLVSDSQTLGKNAILSINGTTIISSSNTVTSDISGISGLTLTLNTTTSAAAQVGITPDATQVTNALTTLVNAYNTLISDTDQATGTDGQLYGESLLKSIRNKVRTLVTSAFDGDNNYKTLSSIGISTGAIGASTSANTNKLIIDTDALSKALSSNPDAVKNLLVGNGTNDGILDKLKTVVDNATDSTDGYFVTRESSYEKQTSRLNNKITTMQKNLTSYQKQLETKFAAMDKLISSLQKSASIFDKYFNSSKSSS